MHYKTERQEDKEKKTDTVRQSRMVNRKNDKKHKSHIVGLFGKDERHY